MPERDFVKTCLNSLLGEDTSDDILDYVLSIENEDDFVEFMHDIITNSNPEHKLVFQKLRNNLFGTSTKQANNVCVSSKPDVTKITKNTGAVSKNIQPKVQTKPNNKTENKNKKGTPAKQQSKSNVSNKNNDPQPRIENTKDVAENTQNQGIDLILKTAKERSVYRDDDYFKKFEIKPDVLQVEFDEFEDYERFLNENKLESVVDRIPSYNQKDDSDVEQSADTGCETKRKKRTKYINLYEADNKTILRKGRHPCQCQAMVHALINNCLSCGRIVCEQEGSGPCFFCNEMVCTQEEEDILSSDSKQSHKLYNRLMEQKTSKEWKKAIELRNKLVSIDRLGDGKNIIYDDQSDYFDLNNKWASEDEKRRIEKRRMDFYNTLHKPISEKKTTLNISGDGVSFTSDRSYEEFEKNMLVKINKANENADMIFKQQQFLANIPKRNDDELNDMNKNRSADYMRDARSKLLTENENGSCLSMHQPHATLLIAGIKRHEGRSWSTNHRGPLWIASTAKPADEFDVADCEEMYRVLYKDENLEFPKTYPSGCLLGCVYVEDCLSQNEYRKKYPDGESSSPFVFICSHPVALPVFIPVTGQHKIYQLNKSTHQKAKAGLKAAFKVK